jgi:hypothetical protein
LNQGECYEDNQSGVNGHVNFVKIDNFFLNIVNEAVILLVENYLVLINLPGCRKDNDANNKAGKG